MIYTDGLHLMSDSVEELHEFAVLIGMRKQWFQDHPKHPHYDTISKKLKDKAIKAGAKIVSSKDLVRLAKTIHK